MAQEDMEKRTRQYVELRDMIKREDDAHKAKMKDAKVTLERLGGIIQKFMAANNLENLKTAAGTCYISTRSTASLADPEAFMKHVIDNRDFDLLDRRANVTAVKDFVKKHKTLPPGCNLNTIETVGVRRAGATSDDE
jgi:hypothetical protein